MKFSLYCASNTDKIWEKYPQIKGNFKTDEEHWTDTKKIFDELINVKHDNYYIYIKNVNDLLKLKEITKQDLVICDDIFCPNMFKIIIYDDYLE